MHVTVFGKLEGSVQLKLLLLHRRFESDRCASGRTAPLCEVLRGPHEPIVLLWVGKDFLRINTGCQLCFNR